VTAPTTAPASGAQFEIFAGDRLATLVEVGGGIRRYTHAGRAVLDGLSRRRDVHRPAEPR
jgi:hypothetical protein